MALCAVDTASFVLWPDMTLGFVLITRDDAAYRARLIASYQSARSSLELLALEFFQLFDRTKPQ
ncbi:hypothetical protein ASE08_02295 [Rhizobacter sp. Root16D2]|nr:hypothetical protein ASE08_02295 [Rhizobacter sp. Root16D2]